MSDLRHKAAVDRVGAWESLDGVHPAFQEMLEEDREKALSIARSIAATFARGNGKKTLNWMIQNFLLQAPGLGEEAAIREGQRSVVIQILINIDLAKNGLPGEKDG